MDIKIISLLEEIRQLLSANKKVLNIDDFCAYTGLSKSYAYQLTASRKIKYYRPFGKVIFFDLDDINTFLKRNPSNDNAELSDVSNDFLLKNISK